MKSIENIHFQIVTVFVGNVRIAMAKLINYKKRFFSRCASVCILAMSALSSCSPNSLEEFRYEGESRCKELIETLQKIHNRDELVRAEPLLKKKFEDLVNLMIRAREFQENHPDEEPSLPLSSENIRSAQLEEELRRIYALEGGREIIERAQQEALVRLDAAERACTKRRELLR